MVSIQLRKYFKSIPLWNKTKKVYQDEIEIILVVNNAVSKVSSAY